MHRVYAMTKKMFCQNNGLVNQFIRYLCVGGISAFVDWGLFYSLHIMIGFHYIIAATISFLLSVVVNFFLGREYVFKNQCKFSAKIEALNILLINSTGLLWDLLIMSLAIEILNIQSMIAKIGATGIVFMWNFSLRRWWLYKCK